MVGVIVFLVALFEAFCLVARVFLTIAPTMKAFTACFPFALYDTFLAWGMTREGGYRIGQKEDCE